MRRWGSFANETPRAGKNSQLSDAALVVDALGEDAKYASIWLYRQLPANLASQELAAFVLLCAPASGLSPHLWLLVRGGATRQCVSALRLVPTSTEDA